MKKLILLNLFLVLGAVTMFAQTIEELKAQKAQQVAQLEAIQATVADLDKQILEFPGWQYGGVGTIGFSALANNNWYAIGTPNASSNTLAIGLSGYANNNAEKYFWRSLVNINVARSSALTDKGNDNTRTIALTNGLDLSSLFGYKLNEKWAISAEGKWISSVVEFTENGEGVLDDEYKIAFNQPGQATFSVGATWTPISNLVVIIHPLGYQKNWPGELISSPGAKIGASYAAEIVPGVSWSSNLSAFVPYSSGDDVEHSLADGSTVPVSYSGGDLFNWTWINGFSFSVWKGIGVSFNLGLRGDKQVSNRGQLQSAANAAAAASIDTDDNPLQSYYTLGLSYTF